VTVETQVHTASGDRIAEALIRYRWLLVVRILLPRSTLFNWTWSVRNVVRHRLMRALGRHEARVAKVCSEVRRRAQGPGRGRVCTSGPDWMRISARVVDYKGRNNAVRVDLHDILGVDAERRIVRVEPRVTVGQPIDHLVPLCWTLPVVPEVDDLTASGLFLGYGVEISSHKHGLFSEIVESCDVVLGDGRLVRASASKNIELFNALPWSHGALGLVVALELRIMPATPYVRLTYHPFHDCDAACAFFREQIRREDAPEFVEGIVYAPEQSVVMTGELALSAPAGRVHAANRWYQPWFASRARRFAVEERPHEEFIPLPHFYRRHHRGIYWESELIVPFGNHPLFRVLLGWMMPPKVSFLRLTQGARIKRYYDEKHVLQDALVPARRLRETLAYFDSIFEAYPVWLCPMRVPPKRPRGFIGPTEDEAAEMFVDVAVITVPGPVLRGEDYNALDATRRMERYLIEIGGYQALYAVTQMSREEFRRMFDLTLYDKVRRDYAADGVFTDVYDKLRLPGAES